MNVPKFELIEAQRVVLLEDFELPNNQFIPKGFESDLGTVPSFFHWVLTPFEIKYSSIIHDFEWLMADSGKNSYFDSNIRFFKNSIRLDKISIYKAVICFMCLEVVRITTK